MSRFLVLAALLSLQAVPIPADLATVTLTATGQLSSGHALVHLYKQDGFKGYVIVNSKGEVQWYYRTRDYPFGSGRRKNGNFVFMDKGRGLVEVDRQGKVVHELPQREPESEMHHDAIVTPQDTVLYIAFDTQDVGGKRLKGEAIWEWFPDTGQDVKRWRSWDFLSPTEDVGARTAGEWLHANALSIGPRGNILLSLHYLNQILSITKDWKSLEWRLGGVRATIPVVGEAFSGQHTAREIAPGHIVLFDNGRDRQGYSRALELEIKDNKATTLWQWRATPDNYTMALSAARRLENGNTTVSFGMAKGDNGSTGPIEAFEVTPQGKAVWHLVIGGTTTSFRVEPLPNWR